jgi:hypothetical protein
MQPKPGCEGEGSCSDLAVQFSSACRAVGLATRFVSAYERDASAGEWRPARVGGSLPGRRRLGGHDPSRSLAVAASHVAAAAAQRPAARLAGDGTFRGSARAMEFSISMPVE